MPVSTLLPHELLPHMYAHKFHKCVEVCLGGDVNKVKDSRMELNLLQEDIMV